MANYDGSLVFDTKIDTSGLQNDLGKLGNVARSGAQVTTAAIASIGAAIASVAAASFKVGSEFESAFAGVQKTVNATEEEFAALRQGILDLARDMPLAATEIAGIAEAAGQLGIQTQNIMSFTKTMADLGVATNMSSEEAATALARLANITQMPQENFDRLGATIVDLGNNLATTEREIVDMSLRLAGAGNQVGLTEDQILSFSGALSSVGIAAEAGGTAFSKLMSDMQLAVKTGSESLQDFADVAGMSAQEFQRAFEEDAASAIISFIDGLANAQDSGVSAIQILNEMGITEIRMRDALLRAAGASDVFSNALKIGSRAWKENTALTNEANRRYETMESQLQILKNELTEMGITIYEGLRDPIKEATKTGISEIEKLTQSMKSGDLKPSIDQLGESFATLMEAIVNIATAAIPILINGFNFIVEHGNIIVSVIGAIVTAMAAFKASMMIQQIIATWQTAALQVSLYSMAANAASISSAALNSSLSLGEIIVGLITKKITIATAAQNLWNIAMSANPIGVVIAALSGLIAVMSILNAKQKEQVTETQIFIQQQQQKIQSIQDETKAYEDLKAQQEENAAANLVEITNAERLWNELQRLVDENGNVLEANKSRVQFILGELNSAMGTEYTLIGNQIQGYQDLTKSIDDVIAKKKAQILLDAQEEVYKEALLKVNQAQTEQAKQSILVAEQEQKVSQISSQIAQERAKIAENASRQEMVAIGNRIGVLEASLKSEKEALLEAQKAYAENEELLRSYYSDINRYETASIEILNGNTEKAVTTLQERNNAFLTAADIVEKSAEEQKAVLEQQVIETEVNASLMRERYRQGINGVTEDMVKTAEEQAKRAREEFEKIGGNITDGIAAGAEAKQNSLWDRIADLAQGCVLAAKRALDINSPSGDMRDDVGVMISAGVAQGIEEGEPLVEKASEDVAEVALSAEEYYLQEKKRIDEKRAKQSAEANQKEYEERLKNAKDAEEAEKIKQERILKLEQEADDQYLADLKEKADNEDKIREAELKNLKYRLDMNVITEAEYYKELESYRDRYFEEGTSDWQSYTSEIFHYNESVLENVKDSVQATWNEIAQQADERSQEVAESISNMSQKLKDYGGTLFETQTITFKGEGRGLFLNENGAYEVEEDRVITQTKLRDLKDDINTLKSYEEALLEVKERGVPEGFFEMMRDMSVEDGLVFAKALLDTSETAYQDFIDDWLEKQRTADEIANVLYGDEKEQADAVKAYWQEVGISLNAEMEQLGVEIPEGFFEIGTDSAENFADGFKQKIETALSEIQSTINSVMSTVTPQFSSGLNYEEAEIPSVENVYNYYLVPSGESTRKQIEEIERFNEVKKFRGE